MTIRTLLHGLYRWSGYAAGLFLVGIAVSIVWQIVSRLLGLTFDATEIAGFCLASSTFFGLAYTLREGGHVRITLGIDRLPPALRRAVEIFNCLVAGAAIAFVAANLILLLLQSIQYHDVSPGLMAIPFWIPQLGACVGVSVFAIALIDELVWIARGKSARYDHPETEPHHE